MEDSNRCHICCDLLDNMNILPHKDDYFGESFSIFKNTYVVKTIDNCKFLYYFVCNNCIDNYLKKYTYLFKYIKNREIGILKL